MIVYGIPNCDTVKKARAWLDAHCVAYTFHDYKMSGAEAKQLARWCDAHSWQKVLNRASTTFKQLPDADKADLDRGKAIRLMVANPSMIKRPVVEHADGVLVGFEPDTWDAVLIRSTTGTAQRRATKATP